MSSLTCLANSCEGGSDRLVAGACVARDQVRFCESVAVLSQRRLKRISWSAKYPDSRQARLFVACRGLEGAKRKKRRTWSGACSPEVASNKRR